MSLTSQTVSTSRLNVHYLDNGGSGTPVVFIHGNTSCSAFFRSTLARLPKSVRGLAPDLRGYGQSDALPVDATRGVADWSDDVHSFLAALGLGDQKVYLVGWSVGGAVGMRYVMDHADQVAGLLLLAPMSPYGFGGTRGLDGKPCSEDFAGSGGGTANPEFVTRLRNKDRSRESQLSPRNVMNSFYFKPPFRLPEAEEEAAVSSMLAMRIGDDFYPGDLQKSPNWPGVAPGTHGINNALSPKYVNLSGFANVRPQPKVLWIRGADDQIVSDASLFDLAFLGQLGAVPGWPGAQVCPAQPMVGQMRAVLDAYQQNGGQYQELIFEGCAHSPHIEKPAAFDDALTAFIA